MLGMSQSYYTGYSPSGLKVGITTICSFVILSGDFNLDLLKFESHPGTDDFFKYFGFPAPNLATNEKYRSFSNTY